MNRDLLHRKTNTCHQVCQPCIRRAAFSALLLFALLLCAVPAFAEETSITVTIPVNGTGTFSLYQEETVVETQQIRGDGRFLVSFTKGGTYTYTVKSTDAWNKAEYLVTVVVRPDQESAGGLNASLVIQNMANGEKSEIVYYPLVVEDPPVAKRVAGNGAPSDISFAVAFSAVSTTSGLSALPMPNAAKEQTVSIMLKGGEEKELGPLVFDQPGEYVYEVKEVAGSTAGFTYDPTSYRVVYQVIKDDAGFHCTKKYYKDGTEVELLRFEFVNRYSAQSESNASDDTDSGNKGAGRNKKKEKTDEMDMARDRDRSGAAGQNQGAPGTGDETDLLLWVVLLLLSAGTAFACKFLKFDA